jgi:hypothetical protein
LAGTGTPHLAVGTTGAIRCNKADTGYRAWVRPQRRPGIWFGRAMRFADGTAVEVDAVLWATGFDQDDHWPAVPRPRTRPAPAPPARVTPGPGLYLLGLPWQHTTARRCWASSERTPTASPPRVTARYQGSE